MKPNYTEVETPSGGKCIVAEYEDGRVLLIPTDPANSDYQAYLNPVEHLTEIPTDNQLEEQAND
jgi:hypothetical protein